jgi:hypothetical protein
MRLEGSALLDMLPQGAGTIAFDTQLRRKAVQKVLLQDPANGAVFVMDDFVGEIVAGSQSFTFEGRAFDGLYGMRYRFVHTSGHEQQDQAIDFEFCRDTWQGRTVRQLPYFEKLYRYFDALRNGWAASMTLEVEGAELLAGSSRGIMAPESINEIHMFLTYIKCMRDLLALWRLDVPFNDSPISGMEIEQVYGLWSLLCRRPKQSAEELSSGSCRLMPQSNEEATALRSSLESGQSMAIAFGREFPEPFNLMGSYVSVSPVRLQYSQVKLRANIPAKNVKAGKSLRLEILPTKDCSFSIAQSDPPYVLVTGPEKSLRPADEIDVVAG